MQVVGTKGIEALCAVMHLVTGTPQPVPAVCAAVIPVVKKLVDKDTGDHAPQSQSTEIEEVGFAEDVAPERRDFSSEDDDGDCDQRGTQPPVACRAVTAFLYVGLGGRPFWNSAIITPKFLASAFAAGPAFIILTLQVIRKFAGYRFSDRALGTLKGIVTVALTINMFLLASELFTEFYAGTAHISSTRYLYFGLHGYNGLVPWIWTGIAMNVLGTLILAFKPGGNRPIVLVPACILLFLGIWIEKGIGTIIPGLVPSPLGEIVNYTPSWVEVCVTMGVLALGVFIVSVLLKPALAIEQRYEAQ